MDNFYLKPLKPKLSKAHLILTQWIIFKKILFLKKAKLLFRQLIKLYSQKLNLLTS